MPRMRSVEAYRITHRLAFGKFKINAAQSGDTVSNRSGEVSGWRGIVNRFAKNLARFFLHRAPILGSTDAKPLLQDIVQIANRDESAAPAGIGWRGKACQGAIIFE